MGETAGQVGSSRSMAHLDPDSLAHCASKVAASPWPRGVRDLANMAASCKHFRSAANSDSVWLPLFRERWPNVWNNVSSPVTSAREEYLGRHIALLQFEHCDPYTRTCVSLTSNSHVFMDGQNVILAKRAAVQHWTLDDKLVDNTFQIWGRHNARITCMRKFPISSTSLQRNKAENEDSFFATSSCDHTICLWWKGICLRTFRGHSGPVTTIADELVEDCDGKLLASGGEDGTIRLWSLSSTVKRGQNALKGTLHGHEKPIVLLSVSGFNASRLISVSKDAKLRLWDANSSFAIRSSQCLGMAKVEGDPVAVKCHERLCYVAASCVVTAIDLRTMRQVSTVAVDQSKLHSMQVLPSKSLICTGGSERSFLWDVRKSGSNPESVFVLDGHEGDVSQLYMDSHRIVTGGTKDSCVNVWQTDTGRKTSSLDCLPGKTEHGGIGLTAMDVNGYQIVTSCGERGVTCYRDFTQAFKHVPREGATYELGSKFWDEGGILLDES